VVTLWAVSTLVFTATQALPADPAQAILGQSTPEQIDALRQELGLNRPVLEQYTSWLGGVARGNLGESLSAREPVTSLIGSAIVNSLVLLVLTAAIAIPGGLLLGLRAGVASNGRFDRLFMSIAVVFTALPEFIVGMVMVMLFSTTVFTVLPAVASFGDRGSPFSQPEQLILPVATLVLACFPYIFRLARASMIEVMASDYVTMARLKGMPERRVIWRHAAPNALVAVVQASAVLLAYLLGGVVIVEFVFAYPGIGTALTQAVSVRDLPTIQGIVLVLAGGVVLLNVLADVMTVLLTPRLRTGSS
jgi:peptide/nickel transport system permease protein